MFASAMATAIIGHVLATQPTSLNVDLNQYLCMVEAIHFEAKGESIYGKKAVAHVILNRVDSSRFPSSVCGVVKQNKQFSYRNGVNKPYVDIKNKIEEDSFYETAEIAFKAVNGMIDEYDHGCDHYYAHNLVQPKWADSAKYEQVIDNHTFVKL